MEAAARSLPSEHPLVKASERERIARSAATSRGRVMVLYTDECAAAHAAKAGHADAVGLTADDVVPAATRGLSSLATASKANSLMALNDALAAAI